jgi:hypothetical protein
MDARTSRRGKRISKQQEKRAAADLGGRTQAASGGTRLGGGGDVRLIGDTLIECKVTEKHEYTVKKDELLKLWKQATIRLETPVFQFAFRSKLGRLDKYAVIMPSGLGNGKLPYDMDTNHKSITLPQDYLQNCLRDGHVILTFREGAYARQWEVVTWDEYLKRRGDNDV